MAPAFGKNSVETISVVRANDRSTTTSDETTEILISPEKLNGNRARISIIEIKPGKQTKWQNHEGHEYVMVEEGKVTAEFADTIDIAIDQRKREDLSEGDGVAFNSAIYHSFINKGDSMAKLIIARPTKSLPKGMNFSGYD